MTVGNPLDAHAQKLESMTRNVSGITPTASISQILEMIFPKVNKQHKERSMTCTTIIPKIPKMDNENHVDVVQQQK